MPQQIADVMLQLNEGTVLSDNRHFTRRCCNDR